MQDEPRNEMETFPLNIVWWFSPILPKFSAPNRRSSLKFKILWTSAALFVCVAGTRVPLYGVPSKNIPLRYYKYAKSKRDGVAPTASNPGSLLDLGVAPIIAASLYIQFLIKLGILNFNMESREHRILLGGFKSLLALVIYVGQALFNLSSGVYGPPSTLGIGWCFLIFSQLVIGGYMLVLFGGLLGKGYRLTGLTWLFILTMYQFDLQDSLYGLKLRLKSKVIIAILHMPMLLFELAAAILNLLAVICITSLALQVLAAISWRPWKFVNETYLVPKARKVEDARLLAIFYSVVSPLDSGFEGTALHRLHHSNDIPSTEQVVLITSVIRAAYAEQDRVLHAVNPDQHLTKQPGSPKYDLHMVTTSIDKWRSTITSLRRFPPEVLTRIFWWISESISSTNDRAARSLSSLPWAASQVCQTWRKAALSSPELWRRLPVIDLSHSKQPTIDRQISLLTTFIRRSNETELDVYIWSPNVDCASPPLLTFITKFSPFWARLSVFSTYPTLRSLESVQGALPTLVRLTLDFGESDADQAPTGPSDKLTLFSNALRLHHVIIRGSQVGPQIDLPKDSLVDMEDKRPEFAGL
ncbi:hypothetical protein D9619_004504 [Psilocybe cf. subviscida]|uniref:F-box domain-containing protein n=1 Tax=Psilocybe cf. subviscida TaxID=2480587 RepID=A0A8H5BT58_9AGAR|nr:hypothetical protein D9619_004504 [Psilocybe cf. subviscida]